MILPNEQDYIHGIPLVELQGSFEIEKIAIMPECHVRTIKIALTMLSCECCAQNSVTEVTTMSLKLNLLEAVVFRNCIVVENTANTIFPTQAFIITNWGSTHRDI